MPLGYVSTPAINAAEATAPTPYEIYQYWKSVFGADKPLPDWMVRLPSRGKGELGYLDSLLAASQAYATGDSLVPSVTFNPYTGQYNVGGYTPQPYPEMPATGGVQVPGVRGTEKEKAAPREARGDVTAAMLGPQLLGLLMDKDRPAGTGLPAILAGALLAGGMLFGGKGDEESTGVQVPGIPPAASGREPTTPTVPNLSDLVAAMAQAFGGAQGAPQAPSQGGQAQSAQVSAPAPVVQETAGVAPAQGHPPVTAEETWPAIFGSQDVPFPVPERTPATEWPAIFGLQNTPFPLAPRPAPGKDVDLSGTARSTIDAVSPSGRLAPETWADLLAPYAPPPGAETNLWADLLARGQRQRSVLEGSDAPVLNPVFGGPNAPVLRVPAGFTGTWPALSRQQSFPLAPPPGPGRDVDLSGTARPTIDAVKRRMYPSIPRELMER